MNELESLRAEVARLKADLAQTKAVNQKYLQNVAHQLTAPLGSIKWSIEALKDKRVPIGRKGVLLSSIYSQATILVHLIKNFALMSNLEADLELGRFREKPEPIDVMRLSINLAKRAGSGNRNKVLKQAFFLHSFNSQFPFPIGTIKTSLLILPEVNRLYILQKSVIGKGTYLLRRRIAFRRSSYSRGIIFPSFRF